MDLISHANPPVTAEGWRGGIHPQAVWEPKVWAGDQELGERREHIPAQPFTGIVSTSLQNGKRKFYVTLKHPVCAALSQRPYETDMPHCAYLFLPEPPLGSAPCGLFLLADLTSNLCALCFSDHASEKHCIKPGIVRDLKLKKKK